MMRGYNFGGFDGHMGGFGGGAMLFGGLIVLALLVVGVVLLVRLLKPKHFGPGHTYQNMGNSPQNMGNSPQNLDSAMRILNERYAQGEISDEEYATKKTELRK